MLLLLLLLLLVVVVAVVVVDCCFFVENKYDSSGRDLVQAIAGQEVAVDLQVALFLAAEPPKMFCVAPTKCMMYFSYCIFNKHPLHVL